MQRRSQKLKSLLVLMFMLVSIVALAAPGNPACAFGFCEGCIKQCHDEGTQLYLNCLGTKPERQCYDEWQQYESNCASVFCPGCPTNH